MDFNSYIRDVPDFPKPGIVFKDITPLLQDSVALKKAADALVSSLRDKGIDKVVAMESRGFLLGPMLAERLGAGFVPIRKKGKLPYRTLSESYDLEYGTDILEIHVDGLREGEKVLIHDDVLATGGTALAATKLVDNLGGVVVQCNFLIELSFLNGREKLTPFQVKSLISY